MITLGVITTIASPKLSISSIAIASILIIIAMCFSYSQKLKLEKDIFIGAIRAIVQLTLVGYILNYVFGMENPIFTTALLLIMLTNAAINAKKRGKNIKNSFFISFISIGVGALLTLLVLLLSGAIKYTPYEMIPVSGMIISNAMSAIGLCFKQMTADFTTKYVEVETMLSLGADTLPSSIDIVRDSIKTGMQPTIDSMKTLGIVALPGMMTGLILAGTSPLEAIKYQILVTFMLVSCTSIASFIACYLSYTKFFNNRKQLLK